MPSNMLPAPLEMIPLVHGLDAVEQVILNSLSQNALECPPLDERALRTACTQAFKVHCGSTTAVTSAVNGAG